MMRSEPDAKTIDAAIRNNISRLSLPGVLTVRPGFEIAGHQLTGRSAVVATVHTKKSSDALAARECLPEKIDGIPVDVREASAYQRLRSVDPASAAIYHTHTRPEDRMPTWDLERELPSGKLLSDARSATHRTQVAQIDAVKATSAIFEAQVASKRVVPYDPTGLPDLKQYTIDGSKVTASISPDAGLATLEKFLGGTSKSLTVGMYDFTSAPILSACAIAIL
jgi:hypothetical protein